MTAKLITPALLLTLALAACKDEGNTTKNEPATTTEEAGQKSQRTSVTSNTPGQFIVVDSANRMIGSYLNSINYMQNDSDLHSLIIDADSLRAYLANPEVKNVKIMFAHTLEYINNGGQNLKAGYQSGKLTMIIAGYDKEDNYVFYTQGGGNRVINHGVPCPHSCPTGGTAASDLLQ